MTKGACQCGAGVRREGDSITILPHDMGCPQLAEYVRNNPPQRLEGEEVLQFFDAAGSGWIREELAEVRERHEL